MKQICVFGSSSEQIDRSYLETAEELGKRLVQKGYGVIFGAGRYGIMGAVSRGVIAEGGSLLGISPDFFVELNVLVEDYGELILTHTMRERKALMEDKADAFVICAGGIGTLEEFFEVITLKQLGRHKKPIIIYNYKGYYDELIAMMNASVEKKFMSDKVNKLYTVADTEEEVMYQLENYKEFNYSKYE